MRALLWDGARLAVGERALAAPAHGRAVVKVSLAGICSTDLQIFRGYMAFTGVPGHEVVGVVEEGPAHLAGQRVTGEINFACEACAWCARGLGRHCPTRTVMGILGADGALAERVAIPASCLHVVPDGVSDEEAVFTEPLAAAYEVLEQVRVAPGDDAVVLGDGKLGLLVAQVLHAAGARVLALGRHPRKLALLAALGIETALVQDARPAPVGLVVEATGSRDGLRRAIELVRPRGTLVLKSTVADEHALSLAALVINEVTVVGSRCGPFAPALGALALQRVDVSGLVDRVYPLEDAVAAVEHAGRPGALKVLVRP